MFIPAIMLGWEVAKINGRLLADVASMINKAYNNRPYELEGKDLDELYFVQDLDIGQMTGIYRHLYRGPYYKRYINRIKQSKMNVYSVTDRPAKNVLEELAQDGVYNSNGLIVTNGGAMVFKLDNPDETNIKKRYKCIKDAKISQKAAEELRKKIEQVSSNGSGMPSGALVVSTNKARHVVVPKSTSLYTRAKICFGLKRQTLISGDSDFSFVSGDARNLSFEVFPKFSSKFFIKRTKGLINIPYISYDKNRSTNLPTLRNLFSRHANTHIDGINQAEVVAKMLANLVSYSGADPQYITDEVCVTLSTRGLEFVPKGCSKMSGLIANDPEPNKTLIKDHEEWEKRVKSHLVSGDNFSDFFEPVSLKDLRKKYEECKNAGVDFGQIAIELFLNMSKPMSPLDMVDIAKMGFRYNVTTNSLSSICLSKKFEQAAKEYNKVVLDQAKIDDINLARKAGKQEFNSNLTELKRQKILGYINGVEFDAGKKLLGQQYAQTMHNARDKAKNRKLSIEEQYEDKKHSGKSGKEVLDYTQSFVKSK